jgi:hypothetical protein
MTIRAGVILIAFAGSLAAVDLTELKEAGLIDSSVDTFTGEFPFGYIDKIEISHPSGWPEALLVKTSVTIPCGTDDSVYLYEPSGRRLRIRA